LAPSPDTPVIVWSGITMTASPSFPAHRSACLERPRLQTIGRWEPTPAAVRALAERHLHTLIGQPDGEHVTSATTGFESAISFPLNDIETR
jgi:hypothetical protein